MQIIHIPVSFIQIHKFFGELAANQNCGDDSNARYMTSSLRTIHAGKLKINRVLGRMI